METYLHTDQNGGAKEKGGRVIRDFKQYISIADILPKQNIKRVKGSGRV
jgi:hypothetical protein